MLHHASPPAGSHILIPTSWCYKAQHLPVPPREVLSPHLHTESVIPSTLAPYHLPARPLIHCSSLDGPGPREEGTEGKTLYCGIWASWGLRSVRTQAWSSLRKAGDWEG